MFKNGKYMETANMKRCSVFSSLTLISLSLVLSFGFTMTAAQAQNYPDAVFNFPDLIFTNATIITLDDHEMNSNPGTIVQAMAIRDGVIMGLGTNEEILRYAGPNTRVMDLLGKTVFPGIVDSHNHPMGSAESYAREMFKLKNTPEGYALNMDVSATEDETMAKVARAMELLLATVQPTADEWINISLVHNPELGFATPADVSTLMSAPRLADVQITKEDLTEIVPDYPFVLSSSASILSAPEKNVWFHITAGPEGQPVRERVIELNF
jgi:hypothetical protein